MSRKNTKQWFVETIAWVEMAELQALRDFLVEHGVTRKMNFAQSRNQALQVLSKLQAKATAKAKEAAAKRKQGKVEKLVEIVEPAVEKSEVDEVKPMPKGLVKFEQVGQLESGAVLVEPAVVEEPKPAVAYISEEKLVEIVRDLEGKIGALRNQTDGQLKHMSDRLEDPQAREAQTKKVEEQAQRITALQEQVGKLGKRLEDTVGKEGFENLQRQINGKVSVGSGVVYNDDLAKAMADAKVEFQVGVRQAIGEVLEGKNRKRALELWDRTIEWLEIKKKDEVTT